MNWVARAVPAAALAAIAILVGAVPAGAATVERPLAESNYGVRPLCGEPGPGEAACLALRLVAQTAAARAHSTPIGLTVHHAVEPASAADGAFGLRPQDLHDAYSLPTAAPASQTVAVVDAFDDPTVEEDLIHYSQEFGLPTCTHADGCFTKVNQAGEESHYPSYDSGWAGEIALDVETVHAVCQNCQILLVEANNSSTAALEVAENTAVAMGATEVSDSFGGAEPAGEGSAFNHPGTVIAASTGDDGYLNWSSSSAAAGHPSYPASSPDVVAVGGTRLTLNGASWAGETVWNDGSKLGDGHGAGGSACSEHPNAQSWQRAVPDWAEVGCGEKRAAADVAADADPYSGVAVYRGGSWSTVGGTSLAAPIVASTFALAGGSGGVSYPAQTLYGHLGTSALHDVTSGSNGECTKAFDEVGKTAGCTTAEEEQDCQGQLICRAGSGYDGPTGVGTPAGLAAFAPPAPAVSSVSPSEGDLGTEVTIEGEHLKGVGAVGFDGVPATHVVEVSATKLTATAPGHAPGQVDVTVTTGGGTSATSGADHFTYLPAPAIAGVSPARGPTTGGTEVTIAGERLESIEAVSFGGAPATGLTQVSPTEVKATSPAHSTGEVEVTIRAHGEAGAATSLGRFTYVEPPALTTVGPSRGTVAGGTVVTIDGTHLADVGAVRFGGLAAADVFEVSATELKVTSPAHAEGTVDVTVTTPGGTTVTSPADEFEYLRLPVIEGVVPAEGPIAGGTSVTITGHDLGGASAVTFGGIAATSFSVGSGGEITAIAPTHAEGRVDVSVTTPVGASNVEPADGFTFVAAPASVSPPAISGYPMEGRTVSASNGTWTHSPTSFTYKWLRCDSGGGSCVEIAGATAQTYQLGPADVGGTIKLEVTAHNAGGQATATSAATSAVVARTSQSFTWSGATPRTAGETADDWTTGSNWVGGTAPSEATDIGTLTLPYLAGGSACGEPPIDACAQSENTIGGIEVEKISVDDREKYIFHGEPFSLGAGGIEASSSEANTVFVPSFRLPIDLSADQTWSVDGGSGNGLGTGGLEFGGAFSGESHSLHIQLANEGGVGLVGSPDDEVGPLSITGADPVLSGEQASENGILGLALSPSTQSPRLNAGDGNPVRLDHTAMIGAGTLGPLTVEGGLVDVGEPLPAEGDIYGRLAVHGPVTLASGTSVLFNVEGPTPGDEFTQLTATGKVDLTGTEMNIIGMHDHVFGCPSLPAGAELPLISATGELEGTFQNAPEDTRVAPCTSGEIPVLKILYTQHAVVAKSLGPVPYALSPPHINGVAQEEQQFSSYGTWWNSPTSYAYQWLRCDTSGANCTAIAGATARTYTATSGDVGHTLREEETARNAAGEFSVTSAPSGVIAAVTPLNIARPQISGSAVEGQTLTTTTGSWTHSPTSFTYRWLRCDSAGANCSPIVGATGQTYTLGAEDIGHTFKSEVTAHNGSASGSATSAPTATVTPPSPVDTTPPQISGSAVEGQTLTTTTGSWTHSPTSYTYRWLRCDSTGALCLPVAGATGSSYSLTSADVGYRIEAEVTAHDGTASGSATTTLTAAVTPPVPVDTTLPAISGTAVEGRLLSASSGSWTHNPTFYSYQWLRCDSTGNDCLSISGAVGSTYLVTAEDIGHEIEVEVTAHNGSVSGSATSAPTAVVTVPAPVDTAPPVISGTAVQGETLSTTNGTWQNNPTSYTYQWLRCDTSGANCSAIAGATEQTYTPAGADVGKTIRSEVTAHNGGGSGSATSSASATVASGAPSNTVPPQISGTTVQGETLSTTNGSWQNNPTSYSYRWLRCDTSGANCAAISGATEQTYMLLPADVGRTIKAEITATNTFGPGSAISLASAAVGPPVPLDTARPTITGNPVEGEILTAHEGSWEGASYFTYQWLRCDAGGNNCAPVSGAISSVYLPGGEDVGDTIEVEVTAHNITGHASAHSDPTSAVTIPAPVDTTSPFISGTAVQGETLSTTNGTWSHNPTSYTYKWLRCDTSGANCTAITGATAQTYTLLAEDVGKTIRSEVTAHNGGGSGSATSSASGPVASGAPSNTVPPQISGSAVEGQTLTTSNGTWTHNPTSFTYKWLRCDSSGANCTAVSGATAGTYTLVAEDIGHKVKAEVTAGNAFGNGSAVSSATSAVPQPPLNTSLPTISVVGAMVEGSELIANAGSWNPGGSSYTYKWQRCDSSGANCTAITGATAQTYTLLAEDVGKTIRLEVTAGSFAGHGSATSAPTISVSPQLPADAVPPTVSGSAIEGQTLTAGNGSWTHNPTSFTYRWLRCDSAGANCTAISGATSQGYALVAGDVGDRLEVEVTAHNAGGTGSATSAPSAVVTAAQSDGGETPSGGAGGNGGGSSGSGAGGSGGGAGTGDGGGAAAGGGGRVTLTPTPTPTTGTAVAGAQALVKAGKAAIVLRCTGAGSCAGTLLLQVAAGGRSHGAVTIGRAGFRIRSGAKVIVSVHLNGKGKRLVRKAGRKGLEAQLAGTGIAPGRVKLKA